MLHAGLDLSRRRLDVCLLSDHGEVVDQIATPPDFDGLRGLTKRVSPRNAKFARIARPLCPPRRGMCLSRGWFLHPSHCRP